MPRLISGETCVVRSDGHLYNGREGVALRVGDDNIARVMFGNEDGSTETIDIPLVSLRRIVTSEVDASRDWKSEFQAAFAAWEKLGTDVDRKRAEVIAEAAAKAGVPSEVADGLRYLPFLQRLDLPSPGKEIIGALITALVVAAKGYGIASEVFDLTD